MLVPLVEEVNNLQEEVGYKSREMETLHIKNNNRNKEDSNRNEEWL